MRLGYDMYKDKCMLGVTDGFTLGDLSSFLFATVMDRLTDDVGQKSL